MCCRTASTRLAVSGLFLLNGTFAGAWAPKIPEFASRLDLSESGLGLMIMCFGIGSLVLMPIAGILIAHFGSTRTVKGAAVLFLSTMLLLSVAQSIPVGAVAIFLFPGRPLLTIAISVAIFHNTKGDELVVANPSPLATSTFPSLFFHRYFNTYL